MYLHSLEDNIGDSILLVPSVLLVRIVIMMSSWKRVVAGLFYGVQNAETTGRRTRISGLL